MRYYHRHSTNTNGPARNAVYAIQDKLAIETKRELVVYVVRNGLLDDYAVGEY